MIVLDASAAVLALLNDGEARRWLARETVVIPHLADSEVTQALRAQVLREALGVAVGAGVVVAGVVVGAGAGVPFSSAVALRVCSTRTYPRALAGAGTKYPSTDPSTALTT